MFKKVLLVLLCVILCFMVGCKFRMYNFTGVVKDADSGAPLSGVKITLGTLEAQTNDEGKFAFSAVSAGTYALKAELEGYQVYQSSVVLDSPKSVIIELVKKSEIGEPDIKPNLLSTNTSTDVWMRLLVNLAPEQLLTPEPNSVVTPVEVFKRAGDNWVSLGYLADNGQLDEYGDEIKGDRVYSTIIVMNESTAGTCKLKFTITLASGETEEVFASVDVVQTTGDSVEPVVDVHVEAEAKLEEIVNGGTTNAGQCLLTLQQFVSTYPEVKQTALNGNQLEIKYNSGITSIIVVENESTETSYRGGVRSTVPVIPLSRQTRGDWSGSLLTKNSAPQSVEYLNNRSVLVWAPFAAEFASWDETQGITDRFLQADLGFTVTSVKNTDADIASLHNITGYGMVIFASHGSNGHWLGTGEIVNGNQYEAELLHGQLAIWQNLKITQSGGVQSYNPVYAVSSIWFDQNLTTSFDKTIIVNNSCESTKTNDLWNVFSANGAGTYYGYSRIVSSKFCCEQVYSLVENLRDGTKTTGQSYIARTDPYGSHQAVWEIRGNQNLAFGGGLVNGSFEQGLNGWSADGDGRAIVSLAFLAPTHGKNMGIISSGLGFTVAHGRIRQSFKVSDTATTLSFDWNYLSEELLEWVDSIYQDPFKVSITPQNGTEETLLYQTVMGIYQTFGSNLVSVSPQIVFDQGGVYMTDWQNFSVDISAYRGKTVTLEFKIVDEGDEIYDTAVLLDNIKIQ